MKTQKPERVVFAADLSDELHVRIVVSGEWGKKEIGRLIEVVKLQKKFLLQDRQEKTEKAVAGVLVRTIPQSGNLASMPESAVTKSEEDVNA